MRSAPVVLPQAMLRTTRHLFERSTLTDTSGVSCILVVQAKVPRHRASAARTSSFFYVCKKDGNHTKMQAAFHSQKQKMDMSTPRTLMHVFRQASVDQRGKRTHEQAFATRDSMEWQQCLVISKDVLGTGTEVNKKRKHFAGFNTSGVIGFIDVLPSDSPLEFKPRPEDKTMIIGGENLMLGSGGSHISVANDPGFQSKPGQLEPFFFPFNASTAGIGDDPLLQT